MTIKVFVSYNPLKKWPQSVMTNRNRFLPATLASLRVLVEMT